MNKGEYITLSKLCPQEQCQEIAATLREASTILQHEPGWAEELSREEDLLNALCQSFSQEKQQPGTKQAGKKQHRKKRT